jgi:hypothetical protein
MCIPSICVALSYVNAGKNDKDVSAAGASCGDASRGQVGAGVLSQQSIGRSRRDATSELTCR